MKKWQDLYMINKVATNRQAFGEKVIRIATEMDINPQWLMGLMYFETARTMSHTITNSAGCVGLIQFCSSARADLNITANELRTMSNVRQLDYVRQYFLGATWKRRLVAKVESIIDLYLIIFYPLAVGKHDGYILGSHNGTWRAIYKANPAFQSGSGKITIRDITVTINNFLPNFDPFDDIAFSVVIDNEVTITPQKTAKASSSWIWILLLLSVAKKK